jgi:hypothetical protein
MRKAFEENNSPDKGGRNSRLLRRTSSTSQGAQSGTVPLSSANDIKTLLDSRKPFGYSQKKKVGAKDLHPTLGLDDGPARTSFRVPSSKNVKVLALNVRFQLGNAPRLPRILLRHFLRALKFAMSGAIHQHTKRIL